MGDVNQAGSGSPAAFGLLGKYLRWEVPEIMGEVGQLRFDGEGINADSGSRS